MLQKNLFLAPIAAVMLAFAAPVSAGGGQNANNNPNGEPSEDTFNPPYASYDEEGRMMIFCAEDELLVVAPPEGGALEVTCQPAE